MAHFHAVFPSTTCTFKTHPTSVISFFFLCCKEFDCLSNKAHMRTSARSAVVLIMAICLWLEAIFFLCFFLKVPTASKLQSPKTRFKNIDGSTDDGSSWDVAGPRVGITMEGNTHTHTSSKKKGLNGRDGSGTRSFITVTVSHHCDKRRVAAGPQCSCNKVCHWGKVSH